MRRRFATRERQARAERHPLRMPASQGQGVGRVATAMAVAPAPDLGSLLRRAEILGHRAHLAGPQPAVLARARWLPAMARSGPIQRQSEQEAQAQGLRTHLVGAMERINVLGPPDRGVWYRHVYRFRAAKFRENRTRYLKWKDFATYWKDDYDSGYADPDFFESFGKMRWRLKPGVSAAKGIQKWLAGLTIAECGSALIAIETDALRNTLGDAQFDRLYADLPQKPALRERLVIAPLWDLASVGRYLIDPVASKTAVSEKTGTRGNRPVARGDGYYFANHPKYVLKHPTGAVRGENVLCMDATPGRQLWAGFGFATADEVGMLKELAEYYNQERTEEDYKALIQIYAPKQLAAKAGKSFGDLYESLPDKTIPDKFREGKGFEKEITWKKVDEEECQVDGVVGKGGFVPGTGQRFSYIKVAAAQRE